MVPQKLDRASREFSRVLPGFLFKAWLCCFFCKFASPASWNKSKRWVKSRDQVHCTPPGWMEHLLRLRTS